MSIRQGNKVLSAGQSLTQNLFDFKWADHIFDDIQWLRADTFTWHDGRVYEAAYQHLLAEWNEVGDVPSTEIIAGTQIYYRLAPDGHKICSASQEDEAVAIYDATGIAWYYILDTTNQRFKLPRTKFGFVGLRDNDVGKYIAPGLPEVPDHTHPEEWPFSNDYVRTISPTVGAAQTTGSTKSLTNTTPNVSYEDDGYITTGKASIRTSNIYGASTTVQSPATQMYLYFFVGNFAQSAVVNTAGINATLVDEIQGECIDLQNNKQDIATAVNYNNITNCVTEIPQDIKLELTNGTLTLVSGSKLYLPNGVGVFDDYTTTQNYNITQPYDGTYLVFFNGSSIFTRDINKCFSGTEPSTVQTYSAWYDTANNLIKYTTNSTTWQTGMYLPIAQVMVSGGVISSIDQVFNGFGYIGSTVFALPGVKGLISDGRNADGSLKNTEFTLSSPITMLQTVSGWNGRWSVYTNGISLSYHPTELEYISDTKPIVSTPTAYWFCPKDNILYWTSDTGVTWSISKALHIANLTESSMKIQSLNWKQPFKAVDYSEADFVVDFQRPTAQNNYTWYRKYKSGWVEQGGLDRSGTAGPHTKTLPIAMNSTIYDVLVGFFTADTNAGNYSTQYNIVSSTQIWIAARVDGVFSGTWLSWRVSGMAA